MHAAGYSYDDVMLQPVVKALNAGLCDKRLRCFLTYPLFQVVMCRRYGTTSR
jgi:hypothetical protein